MRLSFSTKAVGVIAGVALLGATMSAPASAFTLSSPSIGEQFSDSGHVDKVWWHGGWRGWGWRGGWGWRRAGWGWRGGWGPGWRWAGGGWCRWHPYRCW